MAGGGVEYLSFIGLRYDEMRRLDKIHLRNIKDPNDENYQGEYVYTPLEDMRLTNEYIDCFWDKQNWGLDLDPDDNLSNCTYCFMKGVGHLKKVHTRMASELNTETKDTPCDIDWWIRIEEQYGRDLIEEGREVKRDVPEQFIGFFGARSGHFYRHLQDDDETLAMDYPADSMPCACTE